MRHNAYWNPSGLSGAGVVNTEAWRRAELPSTNRHASARGVATGYAALAAGGTLDGVQVVDPAASVVNVLDWYTSSQLVAQTTLRSTVGRHELDQLLSERDAAFGDYRERGT